MITTDNREDSEEFPLAIDYYRIKLDLKAGELGQSTPSSWTDVFEQMREHLMRICSGVTRLTAEAIEGTTRLIRGITKVPDSIATRIASTHQASDAREYARQAQAQSLPPVQLAVALPFEGASTLIFGPDDDALLAVETINEILKRMRARGLTGQMDILEDGRIVFILGFPKGSENPIREILKELGLEQSNKPRVLKRIMGS